MASGGTAVVVGASMGGLLAARALSDSFAEVVVVDRDALPPEPDHRRGVPQGRQLHVLLARGREALEELFPGLSEEFRRLGAPMVDLHGDVHWYNDGHRMARAPSDLICVGASRPLLEHVVRARVAALPGVRFLTPVEVLEPTTTPDRGRVTGVRVRPAGPDGGPDAEPVTVAADLVVDAGGRGSRSPRWLVDLGYEAPAEENVRVDVTYLTRVYERAPHHLEGLSGTLANTVPGTPRGGIAATLEGDRIAVALCGMLGEQPPLDDHGLAEFADALAAPQIADVVRTGTPVTEPVTMRFPASRRRRYERLRRFPEGYLVVADAICSFNPIYGQGMTVAALEALLLRDLLAEGRPGLARRFFRGAGRLVEGPWSIAVGSDLRFPEVAGPRTAKVRLVNAYVHRLHAAATTDPVLGAAFIRVVNLVDPPTRLLAPPILLRVLRGSRRSRAAAAGAAQRTRVESVSGNFARTQGSTSEAGSGLEK